MHTRYTINTLDELEHFATVVLAGIRTESAPGATVIALSGDLGAGKTTLVQALARQLGVADVVVSPTFVIMKSYETTDTDFTKLYHMDAYRIDDLAELRPLRFAELLSTPQTLFCIEWAEKIKDALPPGVVSIHQEIAVDETRVATITGLVLPTAREAV